MSATLITRLYDILKLKMGKETTEGVITFLENRNNMDMDTMTLYFRW